jgi:transcriptional regulator with XRE-family HTH domain
MIRNDHASRDTGLGLRLQDLRHEQRLSISELGRRARISKAYLSQLEAGQRARPSVEKLVAIASVLQVPVSELLPRAEELPGRAGVAPALNELIDERALDSSTVDMLASIRFAGPVPRTRTRWEYIWNAIRTSELLDKDHAIRGTNGSLEALSLTLVDLALSVPPREDLLASSPHESRNDWPQPARVPVEKWTESDNPLAQFWPAELNECPREGQYLKVSRQAVFRVAAAHSGSSDGALRLLVATYAWSAGRDPRAIYRVKNILSDSSPDQVGEKLSEATERLADSGPVTAYRYLAGDEDPTHAVRRLGPAIFTKLLYFAGGVEGERAAGPLRPLILDHRVADAVSRLAVGEHLTVESPKSRPWPTHWYERYLELAHGWAEQLGTAPDVVEWLLWSHGQGATKPSEGTPPRSSRRTAAASGTDGGSWAHLPIGDPDSSARPEAPAESKIWTEWNLGELSSQSRSAANEAEPIRPWRKP